MTTLQPQLSARDHILQPQLSARDHILQPKLSARDHTLHPPLSAHDHTSQPQPSARVHTSQPQPSARDHTARLRTQFSLTASTHSLYSFALLAQLPSSKCTHGTYSHRNALVTQVNPLACRSDSPGPTHTHGRWSIPARRSIHSCGGLAHVGPIHSHGGLSPLNPRLHHNS